VVVKVSERFFRPAEVELLLGDPAKAKAVLGWHPEQLTTVEKLCEEMVDADMELAKLEIMNVEMKKKLKVGGWLQLAGWCRGLVTLALYSTCWQAACCGTGCGCMCACRIAVQLLLVRCL
jgi:hypothetical protein